MLKKNSQKKEVIFPEDSVEIITEILKKNNLKNTMTITTLLTKQKSYGSVLSDLMVQTAKQQISFNQFIIEIKKVFRISNQKANTIAQKIQEGILSRIEYLNDVPVDHTQETKKVQRIDSYRESV